MNIYYKTISCTLGKALIAATERGICAIELGDTPEECFAQLRERYEKASLQEAGEDFDSIVATVAAFLDDTQRGFDLPLAPQGTEFQQQVWHILREIPCGMTLTYSALAERLGQPTGARAVATACAANPIAVVIPCHRIVRSDGTLSGYRWGIERKRLLLRREAENMPLFLN